MVYKYRLIMFVVRGILSTELQTSLSSTLLIGKMLLAVTRTAAVLEELVKSDSLIICFTYTINIYTESELLTGT